MTDLAKKEHKRWGQKYEDNRNWHEYNKQLVKRGEFFLDFDWVKGWGKELVEMNKNKVGAKFQFPKSLIQLQAVWHAKQIPYRMIEGMTKQLSRIGQIPDYNEQSTVNRRVNKLGVKLELPKGDSLCLFSDGTGFQAINGGEYLREKYGKKNRRWVQIIILGDPKTKEPVSFEIRLIPGSEADSSLRQLEHLNQQGICVDRFGGDGAMDKMELWEYLEKNTIGPVIKPDKNARDDTECPLRNREVREQNENGYEKWAEKRGYGHRWTATEGIFSAIKRMFSEQLAARSEIGMIQETKMKVWAYQKLKRYGEA